MGLLMIVLIAVLVLIVLGLGVSGTFEAVQTGWEKLPLGNVTQNFQEAAEKSAVEIAQEIEP